MAINFPSSPIEGQVFNASPGLSFVYSGGLWSKAPWETALPKNYVVNPAMQISQYIGTTATSTPTDIYALDQWKVMGAGTVKPVFSIQQLALATPLGSPNRMRCTLTTVATGVSTANSNIVQPIEGLRVADLQFGTASAIQVVARFGFRSSAAGTFDFMLRSTFTGGRVYPAPFTISAGQVNTDVYFTFAIPGDTTGTWPKDNTQGMEFVFNLQTAAAISGGFFPNVWQSSLAGGPSTGIGVVNTVYDIFDCGLYADPYRTGVAPPFVQPEITAETKRCQRYWYRAFGLHGGVASGTVSSRNGMRHPVPMRTTPTGTIVGAPRLYDGTTTTTVTTLGTACNQFAAEFDMTGGGTFATVGKQACLYYQTDNDYIAMNARL